MLIFKLKQLNNIKRKKLFSFLFIFALLFTNAQIKIGVKTGLNASSLYGDIYSNNSKVGVYAGAYLRLPLTDKISIQPEVLFSMEGAETSDDNWNNFWGDYWDNRDYDEKYELNYIKIPVMIQYKIIRGLRAEIGPQISFLISKKHKYKGYRDNIYYPSSYKISDSNFKTVDVGLSTGVNYELSSGLNFTIRYNVGFVNINDDHYYNYEIRNQVLSAGVGYSF